MQTKASPSDFDDVIKYRHGLAMVAAGRILASVEAFCVVGSKGQRQIVMLTERAPALWDILLH